MKNKPTELGVYLRTLRINNNEILADMAKKLNVTPAYLSAIELGKRNVPENLVHKLIENYSLNNNETQKLKKLIDRSSINITINMTNFSEMARETAMVFARKLKTMDEKHLEALFKHLNNKGE